MTRPASALGERALVAGLFGATCLLSLVSWYTTWQGMALYLSGWFALPAALGVQSALVLVAWLAGQARSGRGWLFAVYAITACVSIAFSYASLHTWFAAKERPALVERRLFDTLQASAGTAAQLLAGAQAEQQKHVLALEALLEEEKTQGHASLGQDQDPYLARVREAVALEARSLGGLQEGAGPGARHAAFDRHLRMARQALEHLQASRQALTSFQAGLRPLDPSEQQLRAYREVYDAVPWREVEDALHDPRFQQPVLPALGDHLDRTASGQEDLLLAFQELATAPGPRHILALLLAAFIDLIVFLVAAASAPHLAGAPEARWAAAGAALDASDPQVFTRDLLRKLRVDGRGLPRLEEAALTPGQRQYCLLLCAHRRATYSQTAGFLLDEGIHGALMESLAEPGLALRVASLPAQA